MMSPLPLALVVEDHEPTAEMFAEMLSISGFEVERATTGQQARAAFAARRPALILLDVMMPGLSGLDLLAEFRAAAGTPVIVITAKGLPSDREAARAAGATEYLTKPVSFQELRQAIARAWPGARKV